MSDTTVTSPESQVPQTQEVLSRMLRDMARRVVKQRKGLGFVYRALERQYAEQVQELRDDRDRYKAALQSTQRGLIRMEVQRDEARTEFDRLRASATSEASQVQHAVRITALLGSGNSVAVCPGCRAGMTGTDQEAQDWKVQHESEGRPPASTPPASGSSDAGPRVWQEGDWEPLELGLILQSPDGVRWWRKGDGQWCGSAGYTMSTWVGLMCHKLRLTEVVSSTEQEKPGE